ncbi:hypothetical protein B0A49_12057, partial [Cryomyces minteri]
ADSAAIKDGEARSDTSHIKRVAYGAGVGINDRAEGYYLGGWLSNLTVPGWNGPPVATSNLLRYDMIGNVFSNNSGPDSTGRAEGAMIYLPASDRGLLVYFGGILDPYKNGTIVGSAMSTIYIYDLASSKWYTQTASGDIPEMRRKFCAGATWAEDRSSYNIYLYGGFGMPPNTTGFDDVYILTIPSFTWIKWYPTKPGPGRPHSDLSCNIIDGSQMLIIGGSFAADQDCDAPTVWGTHNLNLGESGPLKAMWETFWPNITKYLVPPEIVAQVGGGATGGATVKSPAQNWNNRDLAVYFTRQASVATRTPTRAIPTSTASATGHSTSTANGSPEPSHTGTIAGGVVGGTVFLVLLLVSIVFCLRRRRNKEQRPEVTSPQELPANQIATTYTEPKTMDSYATHIPSSGGTYSSGHTTSPLPSLHPASPVSSQHPSSQQSSYAQSAPQGPYYVLPIHDQQIQGFYPAQPLPQHLQPPSPLQSNPQHPPYDPSQDPSRQHNYPPPPEHLQSGHLAPYDGWHDYPAPSPSNYSGNLPSAISTPAQFYPQPLNVATRQMSHEMPLVKSPQPVSKLIEGEN